MSFFPEAALTAGWWAQVASFSGQLYLSASRELRLPRVHEHTFTDKVLWWLARPTLPVLGFAWLLVMGLLWTLEIGNFSKFLLFLLGGIFVIACWKGLQVRPQYITEDHEERKSIYQPMRRFFSKLAALGLIPVFVTTFNEKLPIHVQMALPYVIHGLLWNVHAYAEYLERQTKNKQELAFLEFIDNATGIPEEEVAAAKKKAAAEAAAAATSDTASSKQEPGSPSSVPSASASTPSPAPAPEEPTGDLAAVEVILEAVTGKDIPSPSEIAEVIGVDETTASKTSLI